MKWHPNEDFNDDSKQSNHPPYTMMKNQHSKSNTNTITKYSRGKPNTGPPHNYDDTEYTQTHDDHHELR